jgi:hypothetical protein
MNDKETFKNIIESYPNLSSYICFAKMIKGKQFTRAKITRLMSSLVDKGDYLGSEKSALLDNLFNYSNEKNNTKSNRRNYGSISKS